MDEERYDIEAKVLHNTREVRIQTASEMQKNFDILNKTLSGVNQMIYKIFFFFSLP